LHGVMMHYHVADSLIAKLAEAWIELFRELAAFVVHSCVFVLLAVVDCASR
jgi:hypothetical protein